MSFIRAATRSRGVPANFLFPLVPGAATPSGYTVTLPATTSPVTRLRLFLRYRVLTGSADVDLGFVHAGTWYTYQALTGLTGGWTSAFTTVATNRTDPRTGDGWQLADINTYQWGVRRHVSVASVQLRMRAQKSAPGSCFVDLGYRSGGTFYVVHANVDITSTSWSDETPTAVAVDPRTAAPWTLANVDAYEWGVRRYTGATGGIVAQITQLYVRINTGGGTVDLLVTANGSVNDWTAVGVVEGSEYDAVNDPVATPDNATTYISSATSSQVSVYATENITTLAPALQITQFYVELDLVARDLSAVTAAAQLPAANGTTTDWVATGVAEGSEFDAVNDAAGAPNDTTDYITSTTEGQTSVFAVTDYTTDAGTALPALGPGTEVLRVTITDNLTDHYGAFRVMVRVRLTAASAVQALQLKWGGPNGDLIANEGVTIEDVTSTVQVVDLGRMNIPEQEPPSDVALASFVFSLWYPLGAGSVELYLDAIELWPSENYIEFEPAAGPEENQYAVIDALGRNPVAFLADASGNRVNTLTHVGTAPVLRVGTSRLLVRMSRSRTDDRRADLIGADLTYYARYELQRGAG